jgi:hypothetical protein
MSHLNFWNPQNLYACQPFVYWKAQQKHSYEKQYILCYKAGLWNERNLMRMPMSSDKWQSPLLYPHLAIHSERSLTSHTIIATSLSMALEYIEWSQKIKSIITSGNQQMPSLLACDECKMATTVAAYGLGSLGSRFRILFRLCFFLFCVLCAVSQRGPTNVQKIQCFRDQFWIGGLIWGRWRHVDETFRYPMGDIFIWLMN